MEKENKEATELNFGGRVMGVLRQRGLTQKDLADAVNMTETTISRYLNNTRIPKATVVMNIAQALNVSCDYLLGKERGTQEGPTPQDGLAPCPFCGASGDDISPKTIYPTIFTKGMTVVECMICGAMVIDTDPLHSINDVERKWNRRTK